MSEFLAEARILVRPDTTRFRAQLIAQLNTATRGVAVPVSITPSVTGVGLTALTSQTTAAAVAQREFAKEQLAGAEATRKASRDAAATARSIGQVEKAALASAASMAGLRGAVLTAGTAFLGATIGIQAFGKAVGSAADLETSLNVFRVTAGATADEMERVGETAKELGRDLTLPGVTATDAASTFLELSKAGLSVQDSLAGARGVLQLAIAAQIGFADSAQLTASALNAFALDGQKAVDVADLLTNAANASQASIADMGIALRQSAAIADSAGFSLSETVTFLTQLARAGLAGSDAGTSFRVAIQRLVAPTDAARKAIEGLHLNLRDANGELRPEVFFELGDALERMGRAQADATRQIIFGNDASRAAAFFARINAQAFRDQERALQRTGAAAEVAGARNAGFAGSVENLKNQIAALGLEIGQLTLPALGAATDSVALLFQAFTTQIADTRKEFAGFNDDAEQLQQALSDLSDESGFTDFVKDVASGAQLLAGDIKRASDAADAFTADLLGLGTGTSAAAIPVERLSQFEHGLGGAIRETNAPIEEQTTGLDNLAAAAARAAAAVSRLQGQEAGLEEQVTRARISGDVDAELNTLRQQREALERELALQEAIIARPGTAGEATAREAIRQRILPQLEAINNEISNIIEGQRSENERLAQEAQNAADDRDRAILAAFAGRRDDAERRASAAEDTATLSDDIRAQDRIQALIKIQITKIRAQVKDEQTRKDAIRELRIALIASRQEEDALRKARAEQAAARKDEIQNLNIQIAEERGNKSAIERAIQARIDTLNRQIKAAKGDQVKVKQLILERERLKNQLEELNKAQDDAAEQGKTFAQSAFEFAQSLQGFSANLLGNLIPGFATGGLVGGSQPTAREVPSDVGAGVRQAGVLQAAETRGVRPVQVDTTNAILRQILAAIQGRPTSPPEIAENRRSGSAVFDTL